MKKLTLIMAALLLIGISNSNAQSNKEEVDLVQSIFGMQKKAMVADFLKVDAAKQDAFWKIYDEYETARKDLGKKRIALLSQYAANYNNMSNETAGSWMNQVISQTKATDNLLVTYYKKVKKVTDPVTALKFYHVENYILTSIRVYLLSEVPFAKAK
jgi:F0F1-type ATP synthase delta subunit